MPVFDDQKIKEILLKQNYITSDDSARADIFCKENRCTVQDFLLSEQLITKDLLGQAIAEFYALPYADLNSNVPSHEQVIKISEDVAKQYRLVLFSEDEKGVVITTDQPEQQKEIKTTLQKIFPKKKVTIAYSLSEDIDLVFLQYRSALETRFAKIIEQQRRIAPEIIDEILGDAVAYRASDVHFDPGEQDVVIRFRIDGVLQEAGRISKKYYENIVNRIKVQAHLRTDEHFSVQDGSMRYVKFGSTLDIRISIAPTLDGEKIVLRLLSEYVRGFTFTDLGLSSRDQELLLKTAKKPFGMILVTGPTGSGKTTTLYSLIKFLNHHEINITTIEDPVEYKIAGVNHMQVNREKNITFASGLRSIVRQDPDIILVGEIRDKETAEISVNAALTGHLLFSTFHANDAATAIPRLLDMGVEPFLMSSTLELIIAQRLVRCICEGCRYSYREKATVILSQYPELKGFLSSQTVTWYRGKGCPTCNQTGYHGRIGIFELIGVTPELRNLMLTHPSTQQMYQLARAQGLVSIFEDGLQKVHGGVTTIEELLRVATPPVEQGKRV